MQICPEIAFVWQPVGSTASSGWPHPMSLLLARPRSAPRKSQLESRGSFFRLIQKLKTLRHDGQEQLDSHSSLKRLS